MSSCSKDLPELPELDEELPPEAALLFAEEPEDEGLLVLLCDMDGDFWVLLDCFDVSLA